MSASTLRATTTISAKSKRSRCPTRKWSFQSSANVGCSFELQPAFCLNWCFARAMPPQSRINLMRNMLATLLVAGAMLSAPARADEVKIDDLIVATSISPSQRDATIGSAKAFYQFWNSGDEAVLKDVIAENFTDHTLPAGRPQGPQGPA